MMNLKADMGGNKGRNARRSKHSKRSGKRSRKDEENIDSSSSDPSSSSSSYDSESEDERRHKMSRKRHKKRHKKTSHKRKYEDSSGDNSYKGKDRKKKKKRHRKNDGKREKTRKYNDESSSGSEEDSYEDVDIVPPKIIVEGILRKFPDVKEELKELLIMIDNGQAIDIREMSSKTFSKLLKKLFVSLKLKKSPKGLYLLPDGVPSCLEAIGPYLENSIPNANMNSGDHQTEHKKEGSVDSKGNQDETDIQRADGRISDTLEVKADSPNSGKRRVIGPAMPSAEMLAAAARLTEAEAALREAEEDLENDDFIGPPPPAAVAEAETANDAERFEEVARIMSLSANNPYEILGLNRGAAADIFKKRYWKISLMVHPDKCSHPQAHEAFTTLNKAFKDLQDPAKREVIDSDIQKKEDKEEFEAHLKACREAAQWRRTRGESLPGDDELLGTTEKEPVRDEWMTTLPPERKAGMSMHSTYFSKSEKSGRGDTTVWTDTPLERAQKAKQQYLEAYSQAALTVGENNVSELEKEHRSATEELMDVYNKSKRSMTLVEKHQEEKKKKPKKTAKATQPKSEKEEEWVGNHPWKPWNRETDLSAGRQAVKLDSETMAKGLSSRFASGSVQRSFL